LAAILRSASGISSWSVGLEVIREKLSTGFLPHYEPWVPHIPDFLLLLVGSGHFMRLSLKKGAHVVYWPPKVRQGGRQK
jgi:hypothetical protein